MQWDGRSFVEENEEKKIHLIYVRTFTQKTALYNTCSISAVFHAYEEKLKIYFSLQREYRYDVSVTVAPGGSKSTFIRLWHWKRGLSWTVGQWKNEGMLGRIVKVEKKVRKSVIKIEKKQPYLGACDCLQKEKTVSFSVVCELQS